MKWKILELIEVEYNEIRLFVKNIDEIKVGSKGICNIDFGLIDQNGEINGLIGLDVLINIGAVINLEKLTIEFWLNNTIEVISNFVTSSSKSSQRFRKFPITSLLLQSKNSA